jgi:bacteriorhodopsin|tara:strand:- start:44 stop:898 length:855 start_codon:yes stop_codon:yes gene_type:complete
MSKKVCCALIIYLLFIFAFIPNSAALEESGAKDGFLLLGQNDLVGISFWIATAAMLSSSIFFLIERSSVAPQWRTSMTIATLITGVAFWHYMYMREHWILTGESPIVYRYVDWFITVPLQIVEFYFILAAVTVVTAMLFWRLLTASILMLLFGFLGETGMIGGSALVWWLLGTVCWLYIIYEIFRGEAAMLNKESKNEAGQMGFAALKWIVTIGWAIYPIGYLYGLEETTILGVRITNTAYSLELINIIYNLADLVNKTAFGIAIWLAAKKDSEKIEERRSFMP